jgi:4-amino-4-deoxy-L-arabinose transferase-like glycosyltransferase
MELRILKKKNKYTCKKEDKKISVEMLSLNERIFICCIILFAALLLLLNLQNQYLWQDEAQTALIGETIFDRGLPYGTDGKNFFSQELGAEYWKDYIWRWHTWMQFYLVAASFKLFGTGTFTARLPFALFGIASVPLLYFFSRKLFQNKYAAAVASILILSCIPYLVLSRQCRYYSVTAFFSLLALYSYLKILDRKKISIPLFIISAVFLFHTHYIYYFPLLATVLTHCIFFHRQEWKRVAMACAGSILLVLPWIFWLSGIKYSQQHGDAFKLAAVVRKTISYLQQIRLYVFPLFFLVIPIITLLIGRIRARRFIWANKEVLDRLSLPVLFIFTNLCILSLTSPLAY